jgi:hypothetical protein
MSGHSVDNLAPAAPLMLTAGRVGYDVHLSWNRVTAADLRGYAVYRAGSPGVEPEPTNFLSSAEDTALVDTGAPGGLLYYIVTAVDVHENESDPSDEVYLSPATDARETPGLSRLTVLPNFPNPFRISDVFGIVAETTLYLASPEPSGHPPCDPSRPWYRLASSGFPHDR